LTSVFSLMTNTLYIIGYSKQFQLLNFAGIMPILPSCQRSVLCSIKDIIWFYFLIRN
jgi:hypothetical protein